MVEKGKKVGNYNWPVEWYLCH